MITNKKKLTPKSIISRPRKETFLSRDLMFLGSNQTVELGEQIGEGSTGTIHTVKGNEHLAIKVPRYYDRGNSFGDDMEKEWSRYKSLNLTDEELMSPTHPVTVRMIGGGKEHNVMGLVRPRIVPAREPSFNVKDSELFELHRKLMAISKKGLALEDGVQVGRDRHGRLLAYDLGDVIKTTPSKAYRMNDDGWCVFLQRVGKFGYSGAGRDAAFAKYGRILPE
jgi:hypothetical protein